jgi:transposase
VIETLKDAFVRGRLTRDEFDARAGLALVARTYADLAALTADIPSDQAAGKLARPPTQARRRPMARAAVLSGICLVIAAAAMWAAFLADPGATSTPYQAWARPLVIIAFSATFTALGIFGLGVVVSLERRRSRGELPPPPRADGPAAPIDGQRGGADSDPAPPGQHHDQSRADLRTHDSRRQRHVLTRVSQPRSVRPAPGAA